MKGIEEKDNATFLCQVILKTYEERVKEIRVQVLDNSFPTRIGDRSRSANLQRGHRHKVPCRAPQTPEAPADVVYWSVGEGITTDTEIIAARFFKHGGTNLFFNYGADFSIDSDASLTVNSLESFQENWVTFWCHIFQSNGMLSSSSTEVYISEDQKSSTAFRNSTTSTFYLKRGSKQVLPCTSWTPGDAMCNVQWFHESSEQPLVTYNLSSDDPELDSLYNLAGSFGLVISSANSSHVGQYTCNLTSADSGTKIGVINVFVECPNPGIPEGGTRRGPSSFMPGAEVSFDCHDGYEREGSNFSVCQENGEWSFPAPKCIQMNEGDDGSSLTWLGILGGCLVFIILFLGALWYMYSRRKGCFKRSQQDFNDGRTTEIGSSIMSEEALLEKTPPHIPEIHPLELHVYVNTEGVLVRYTLKSESEIFEDDNLNLSCRHVVISGKSGSGKSMLLSKPFTDHMERKSGLFHHVPQNTVVQVDHTNLHNVLVKLTGIKRSICYRLHLCNVLILIDDCNDERDMKYVMEGIKNKGLLDCHVVMTTTNFTAARTMSTEYELRHVAIADLHSDTHGFAEKFVRRLKTISKETTLLEFLNTHVLFPSIVRCAGFLNFLCLLHFNTDCVRPHSTVGSLIETKLNDMFRKLEGDVLAYDNRDMRTSYQGRFLTSCGKVCLSRMINGSENPAEVPKKDLVDSFENGDVVAKGFKMGLFREFKRQALQGEDSRLLSSTDMCSVKFCQEIIAEFCAGKYLAQSAQEWIGIIDVNTEMLAHVLVFAGSDNYNAACTIVSRLIEIISQQRQSPCSLKDEIQLEKWIEICLEINCEGRYEGQLNKKLNELFPAGQLRFIGVSSHRARLLAYLLKYHSKNKYRLNLKSVQLFRVEKLPWKELEDYLKYSYPDALGNLRSGNEASNSEETAVSVRKQLESRERYMPEFPSYLSDRNVVHTIHSLGLQEIGELQYDECHSSSATADLAQNLHRLEDLESIVLLGPVIGSQRIRDLAHDINKLKCLKKMDLRLNTEMDDRAFGKIVTELFACEDLDDLRISLRKVTDKGFSEVTQKILEVEALLRRLKTLHLLHVGAVEPFCNFFRGILQYMDNLQFLRVSCLAEDKASSILKTLDGWRRIPNLRELYVNEKDVLTSKMVEQRAGGVTGAPSTSGLGLEEGGSGDAVLQMESTV